MSRKRHLIAGTLCALAVLVSACGDDPSINNTTTTSSAPGNAGQTSQQKIKMSVGDLLHGNMKNSILEAAGLPDSGTDAATMEAQLPNLPDRYQFEGEKALDVLQQVVSTTPGLGRAFGLVLTAADCLLRHGAIGAKAFVTQDATAASAILIVSNRAIQNASNLVVTCLVEELIGGGGGWSPCVDRYLYDRNTDGVQDRYYVFTVGTNLDECPMLRATHQQYNPQDF
jgi:hypothetical protein